MSRLSPGLLLAALVLIAFPVAALADVAVDPPEPVEGEPVTLTFTQDGAPLAGEPVTVAYMPGSQVEWTAEAGPTDAAGTASFVPQRFGLVRVKAGDTQRVISVRAASAPAGGAIVFLVAAGLLGALSVLGFRGVFASQASDATSGEGPGTTSPAG